MASLCRAAIVGGVVFTFLLAEAFGASSDVSVLRAFHERSVEQEKGGWVVEYRFEYTGHEDFVLNSKEVLVNIDGDVSNSRDDSRHNNPKPSELAIHGLDPGARDFSVAYSIAEIIKSPDHEVRCRETLHVDIWDVTKSDVTSDQTSVRLSSQRLKTGSRILIQLRFGHEHLFRSYNALLGKRNIHIRLGASEGAPTFSYFLRIDEEELFYVPYEPFEPAPPDKRDKGHALLGTDSLFLEFGSPGHECYRFPDVPVREKSSVTLTVWYYLDPGFEGELKVRLAQYFANDGPWKVLDAAAVEYTLGGLPDRWNKFEKTVHIAPKANRIAANFRLDNATKGKVWVDGIDIVPPSAGRTTP